MRGRLGMCMARTRFLSRPSAAATSVRSGPSQLHQRGPFLRAGDSGVGRIVMFGAPLLISPMCKTCSRRTLLSRMTDRCRDIRWSSTRTVSSGRTALGQRCGSHASSMCTPMGPCTLLAEVGATSSPWSRNRQRHRCWQLHCLCWQSWTDHDCSSQTGGSKLSSRPSASLSPQQLAIALIQNMLGCGMSMVTGSMWLLLCFITTMSAPR
mmetsp:Transcript_25452/g.76488  ORF Transcript_25452/g.76488 Transcript_25452/m.76488 type:complete len:209 (+) Transcript_25452:660-1286(+)